MLVAKRHQTVTPLEELSISDLTAAADLLRAVANPVRMAMLLRIAHEPKCVHELLDDLGISQPLASQHLRILRGAHLVTGTRRGKEIAYTIADEHVAHIVRDAILHGNEHRTL